jgi:DhnA family fructose-bisphosphate aldolase class Ia
MGEIVVGKGNPSSTMRLTQEKKANAIMLRKRVFHLVQNRVEDINFIVNLGATANNILSLPFYL